MNEATSRGLHNNKIYVYYAKLLRPMYQVLALETNGHKSRSFYVELVLAYKLRDLLYGSSK